jgi:hypothetical protein
VNGSVTVKVEYRREGIDGWKMEEESMEVR